MARVITAAEMAKEAEAVLSDWPRLKKLYAKWDVEPLHNDYVYNGLSKKWEVRPSVPAKIPDDLAGELRRHGLEAGVAAERAALKEVAAFHTAGLSARYWAGEDLKVDSYSLIPQTGSNPAPAPPTGGTDIDALYKKLMKRMYGSKAEEEAPAIDKLSRRQLEDRVAQVVEEMTQEQRQDQYEDLRRHHGLTLSKADAWLSDKKNDAFLVEAALLYKVLYSYGCRQPNGVW